MSEVSEEMLDYVVVNMFLGHFVYVYIPEASSFANFDRET